MTLLIIIRYIHFIAILGLFGTLCMEHVLVKETMTRAAIRKIGRVDAIYGISALVILGAGLLLWFVVGKPADFYTSNWIFHIKLTLFLTIGVLSIYPTIFFIKNQKGNQAELVEIPRSIRTSIKVEILLALLIPLLAVLMALGIGN